MKDEKRVRSSVLARKMIHQNIDELFLPPLREAKNVELILAKYYGVNFDEVVVGSGSTEIMYAAAYHARQEAEVMVTFSQTFSLYETLAKAYHYRKVNVPMLQFEPKVKKMQQLLRSHSAIVFIDSPSYVTGLSLPLNSLKSLAKASSGMVVWDNAYGEYEFPQHDEELPTLISEYSNLLVCRTFSKVHALLGLRVGYALGHRDLISQIRKRIMPYSVNSLAQIAAIASLEDRKNIARNIGLNTAAKLFSYIALEELGIRYIPTQSNTLLIKLGNRAEGIVEQCRSNGIKIRDGNKLGVPGYIQTHLIDIPTVKPFIDLLKHEWTGG